MEFYFITPLVYGPAFVWELVNSDNVVIAEGHPTGDLLFESYETCIPASINEVNECLFLRLFDIDDDDWFGPIRTAYGVELDGSVIHNNETRGGFRKVNILGSCNDHFCENKAFFQYLYQFDYVGEANRSHEVSWEVVDTNNTTLEHSLETSPPGVGSYYKTHIVYKCLSVDTDTCVTFRLMDSGGDGGTFYVLNYNGKHVAWMVQDNDLIEIQMGCSA